MKKIREEQDVQNLDELFERYRLAPESHVFAPLADACRKMGRIDEALEICEAGIKRHPVYPSGYVVKGKCSYDRGDQRSARESFERVLLLDENNLVALKFLGMIEADEGHLVAARRHLQRILSLDPDNKEIKTILRMVEEQEKAAEQPSEAADTMDAVDEILDVKGVGSDPDEVLEDESTPVLSIESELSEKTDEISPPAPEVEAAEELETSDELASLTLADIFAAQGYTSKAEKIYREVLRKQPANETVRARLQEIAGVPAEIESTTGGAGAYETTKPRGSESGASQPEDASATLQPPQGRLDGDPTVGEQTESAEAVAARAAFEKRRPEIDEKDSLNHFKHWLTRFQK
jgi:tetratricopeptide (TPR) repeat protein